MGVWRTMNVGFVMEEEWCGGEVACAGTLLAVELTHGSVPCLTAFLAAEVEDCDHGEMKNPDEGDNTY